MKEFVPAYLDPNLGINDLMSGVSFASAGSGFDPLTPTIGVSIHYPVSSLSFHFVLEQINKQTIFIIFGSLWSYNYFGADQTSKRRYILRFKSRSKIRFRRTINLGLSMMYKYTTFFVLYEILHSSIFEEYISICHMNKTNHLIVGPISFNSKIKNLKSHIFLCKKS